MIKKLGLAQHSDLKKNILVGLTYQIEQNVESNIEVLKLKKNFHNIEWKKLKESVTMQELKKKLKKYKNLVLDGDNEKKFIDGDFTSLEGLSMINKKISDHQADLDPLGNMKFKNFSKFISAQDTFKGLKKKSLPAVHVTSDGG